MPASRTSRCGHVRLRLVLAVVLATAWLSAEDAQQPPRLVSAMGINVTSRADPGTGLCGVDECTLREAILVANVSPGGDWVKLALNGTITLASELPDITDDLTIDGTDRTLRSIATAPFGFSQPPRPLP
jgi:CSLREA domain-containing protein